MAYQCQKSKVKSQMLIKFFSSLFLLPPIVSQLQYKFMAVVEDKMNCVQCPTRPESKSLAVEEEHSFKTLWTAGN